MYIIEALYGPYSEEFGVNAAAEANGLNSQGGVAGAAFIPTFDPNFGEVPTMVGATWQGTTLTSALPVGVQSDLYSLNDWGVAVGISGFDNSATEAAILVSGGNTTDLTPVVGQGGIATGINNAGLVCGWALSRPEAFVYSSSTNNLVASIPPLAGQDSAAAFAINSANEVVGTSGNSGFCFKAGTLTPLGPAASVGDINDAGIACGAIGKPYPADYAAAICDVRAAAPMFKEIPLPPGAIGNHGDAINRLGDVVGTSWTAQTYDTMQQSAYIFHNGVSTDLNTLISAPGWHLTFAQDINDAGQITGYGTLDGIPTAFLLSPPSRFSLGEISLPELVGILLGGVAIDGGGWIIIGGVPHPVDPWGPWTQIQPEKRDALVALAMDEIAMFLVDGAARETVRTMLTGIATSRLQALNVQRGRAGSLTAARGRVGARPALVIRQGKLATLLARRR